VPIIEPAPCRQGGVLGAPGHQSRRPLTGQLPNGAFGRATGPCWRSAFSGAMPASSPRHLGWPEMQACA